MERQLQKLGTERFEEVKRRIEENDREEKRRVEYQQFLEVCFGNAKQNKTKQAPGFTQGAEGTSVHL